MTSARFNGEMTVAATPVMRAVETAPSTAPADHPFSDRSAYTALHTRFADELLSYACRRTGRADVAEDLVADVFVAAIVKRAIHSVPEEALRAWLFRCASNAVGRWMRRERVRRRARRRLLAMADATSRGSDERGDIAWSVYMALPSHEQEAIAMHVGCGMSVAQISAALGVAEGTVRSRLSRARATMRTLAAQVDGRS